MAANLFFVPYRPAHDGTGLVVPGAQFYFTLAGTNTAAAPYTTSALTTHLPNPVKADAAGKLPPVYLDAAVSYRLRVYARGAVVGVDTPLEEYDPYIPGAIDALSLEPVAAAAAASAEGAAASAAIAAAAAGGSVADIGLFTAMATRSIPVGVSLVRTSGYSQAGRGAALYVYDAAVDAAYVTANPRTSFRTTNARGFRLSLEQPITPPMFGTVGNGTTDDTVPLQAFFDFTEANLCPEANWGGKYAVNAGLTMGGGISTAPGFHSGYAGDLELVVLDSATIVGPVLTDKKGRGATFGAIKIHSQSDHFAWSSRNFDVGLNTGTGAQLQNFEYVEVAYARYAGFNIRSANPGEDFSMTLRNGFFYACGSGAEAGYGTWHQQATYTAAVNTGSPSVGSQTTVLTVDNLPPADIRNSVYGTPVWVIIQGELYVVQSYDVANSKISVFPWLPSTRAGADSVLYVYGGGLTISGGDAGVCVAKFASTACGVGCLNAALYAAHIDATFQNNAIAYAVGGGGGGAAIGGQCKAYFEVNQFDIVWNATTAIEDSHVITSQYALNMAKVKFLNARRNDDSFEPYAPYGLIINDRGRYLAAENIRGPDFERNVCFLDFAHPFNDVIPLYGPDAGIHLQIAPNETHYERMFGFFARQVVVTGPGAGGKPTANITVFPPDGVGYKINGVVGNAVYNTFTGPVWIIITKDASDDHNYLVSFAAGK